MRGPPRSPCPADFLKTNSHRPGSRAPKCAAIKGFEWMAAPAAPAGQRRNRSPCVVGATPHLFVESARLRAPPRRSLKSDYRRGDVLALEGAQSNGVDIGEAERRLLPSPHGAPDRRHGTGGGFLRGPARPPGPSGPSGLIPDGRREKQLPAPPPSRPLPLLRMSLRLCLELSSRRSSLPLTTLQFLSGVAL